jgi:AraC-like DNA-binding protein
MEIAPAVLTRGESETATWEIVERQAHPALRPYLTAYTGYSEFSPIESRRLHVPHDAVVLIFSLGPVLRVLDARNPASFQTEHRSFVAGLHDGPVVTAYTGASAGIQANITPLGAHLLLDVSMDSVANRVISLDDVPGLRYGRLIDQIVETTDWEARFDILERFLAGRLAEASPSPMVAQAWSVLARSGGIVNLDQLAGQLNLSHKQLITGFRQQVGLTPKRAARVLRFDRAVGQMAGPSVCLAEVAHQCGYYDQAHFNREFREFSGKTPTEYLASRMPIGVAG